MSKEVRLNTRPVAPPEGPPPIGDGPEQRAAERGEHREWLSQKHGRRQALAALAVPVLLVLASFGAMAWFALVG